MSLPAPAPRQRIHHRRIDAEGYLREDGLWDIKARITDVKDYAFDNAWRGTLHPGDPIHDMQLRLTLDDQLTVVAVEAVTNASPFQICGDVAPNFQRLIGVSIGKGWRQAIKARLGGVEGCTHLVELLGPLGTTAFQTIFPYRDRLGKPREGSPDKKPRILDTCHALRSDGPVVQQHFPAFYTGAEAP